MDYKKMVLARDNTSVLRYRLLGSMRWCRVEVITGPLTSWQASEDSAWREALKAMQELEGTPWEK